MSGVAIPDIFHVWLERWSLTVDGQSFASRFGSQLLPVLSGGEPAVLKITDASEELRGGELMAWYGGVGAARVIARENPALLLERVTGDRSLADMARSGRDDDATRILCQTAVALHTKRARPPPRSLVPLPIWFQALEPAAAQHGGVFLKAVTAARLLLAEPRDVMVLHGDFHHDNVLDGGARGWLVIDPKGLIGERGFEYANLFRNPDIAVALAPGQMQRRARIVADEARLETRRLLNWVIAYAGLGAAWTLQSGQDPGPGLAIAEQAATELSA